MSLRRSRLFLVAVVVGVAAPSVPGWSSPEAVPVRHIGLEALVCGTVQGTAMSASSALAQVQALPPKRLARARAVLRELVVSDPFTRVALQLPLALRPVVDGVDRGGLDREALWDWDALKRGLAAHVAILDTLGVDLAAPQASDPLGGVDRGRLLVRVALEASADPVAATRALIEDAVAIAVTQDDATRARIDALSAELEAITGLERPCPRDVHHAQPGQPWTLGHLLGGWHDALSRIRPFARDPAVAQRIDAMDGLLEAYEVATLGGPSWGPAHGVHGPDAPP